MKLPKSFGSPPGAPGRISLDEARSEIQQQIGTYSVAQDDPAFVAGDPLSVGQPRAAADVIYRDLPLITIQNSWGVPDVRSALQGNMAGVFEVATQLWESIRGDDRVSATLGSRVAGLFGREVKFRAADDSAAARECLDAWVKCWPGLAGGPALRTVHEYGIGMGWAPAQIVWDTSGPVWAPSLRFWNNRFTYYHWSLRRYVALTLDGQIPIEPGDGKWLLHSAFEPYRAWVFGALRAVAEPWLLRHFAFRDMARYSEVHGLPTRIAEVPAAASADERSLYGQNVANLGTETTLLLQKGVDEQNSYGFRLVEAMDPAYEVFSALISQCDMAIVLALMFQNLTTEVSSGSFAATQAHMDIRQSGLQADNAAWKHTIHAQIARPFALFNFGDAGLAPVTEWDVTPLESLKSNAEQFQKFCTGLEVARRGGIEFVEPEAVRKFCADKFGLDGLPDFRITEPVSSGMGSQKGSKLPFTPVDPAQVVKVNEAREMNELPPIPGGDTTIAEFHADADASRKKDVDAAGAKSKADAVPAPKPPKDVAIP